MKSFWKTTLAVIVGIFITGIISTVVSFLFLILIFAMSAVTPSISSNSVLKIDMSQIVLSEQTQEAMPDLLSLSAETQSYIGLWDAVQSLKIAKEDPSIKLVYIKVDGMSSGMASLQEFRAALQDFRTSGKAVVAYTENPSTGSIYLASACDKVYMTPHYGGMANFNGISGSMMFYKDLLDKLGVNVQLIRHGKYKSAGEPFIRNSASPENMEQNQEMINSIWKVFSEQIAQGRGISIEDLNKAIDNLELCEPEDFLKAGLVDELLTRDQLEQKLADLAVVGDFSNLSLCRFADYVMAKTSEFSGGWKKKNMAVLYVDGEIVPGNSPMEVAGDYFAEQIKKVRENPLIDVVVLRVNSPGGSVLASEKIKAELDLLGKEKRVIASYGNYAASGGYWISSGAEKIYADAATLTGSIGVFGMIPDFSKTLKNVAHVNVQPVNSNKHSDMYSMMRPFDAAEMAYMQRSIEDVYSRFVSLVASTRSMEEEKVDEIAQGRVWTGADALGIGLVDEIGTLEDAINYAAEISGEPDLKEWAITGYPAPISALDQFLAYLGGSMDEETVFMRRFSHLTKPQILARMPYEMILQ